MRKTTKAEFNRFKKEFQYWVEKFGLKGYKVYFFHKALDGSYAETKVNEQGKVATVTYGLELTKIDCEVGDGPEADAKHEAIHLLLHKIGFLGEQRWTASDEIRDEAERLVIVLEKVL
ncbi:hypothetical protein LCGC14_0361980 [marine sediment metagenome]|uniref:SprT-like domain-containing protein n=1 Tax=marine sediment metagenome TaxID=412755 RepID=A0A0F9T7N0_9ZZZZ